MKNEMALNKELCTRLQISRDRLGLTIEQLALLIGVSETLQKEIEQGNRQKLPAGYLDALAQAGADLCFVTGEYDEAPESCGSIMRDEAFLSAVQLMLKSKQAVKVFYGQAGEDSPELVAALMNATLIERHSNAQMGKELRSSSGDPADQQCR